MKRFLYKILKISGITFFVVVFALCLETLYPSYCFTWTLLFGEMYCQAGKIEITISGKTTTHTVYKAKNKPFVLIHFPFRWDEEVREDFLFVNPKQVIGTSTEGVAYAWFRFGPLLFIMDDMASWDRVRMPFWDYLIQKDASVEYDAKKREYVYHFRIHSPEEPAVLRCPDRLFTPDLLAAPNDTLRDTR